MTAQTSNPGRCQVCGDSYGPWDLNWICEWCLKAIEHYRNQIVFPALFSIEQVHHIHGHSCLCGFTSARSRSRTEHITGFIRDALGGDA